MTSNRDLRISNWNVQRALPGQKTFDRISDVISSVDSDFWFLTETHEQLTPAQDFFGIFSGVPERNSKSGERWSAIWSRWPITPLTEFVSSTTRCVAGLVSESAFGEIVLYGTVLPWSGDRSTPENGNLEAYRKELEIQCSDWLRIKKEFPEALFILAGDFNQSIVSKPYYGSSAKRALLEKTLAGCELFLLTSELNDPVFRDSKPMACIDHICISNIDRFNLHTTQRWPETATLNGAPSDHYQIKVHLPARS